MIELNEQNLNDAKKYFDNYMSSYIDKMNTVETNEYMDWLVEFTDKTQNKYWSDDDYIYNDEISEEEKYKIQLLSYFYSFVSNKKREQQIIFSQEDITDKDGFYEEILIFKLRNNFYKMFLAVGQGAFTSIEKLEIIPQKFVYIDEEMPDEEKENNLLIEYIIINSEISFDKLELLDYVSSISTIVAIEENKKEEYNFWYKKSLQKRMFIYLNNEELEILSKDFFNIKYQETEKIAIVSFGIKTKYESEKIINEIRRIN